MSRAAVFLDRDGTLIEEVGFVDRLDLVVPFPWTGDAIRLLNRAGLVAVVVTNQSGIARGLFDAAWVDGVHRVLDERLAAGRARMDAYYVCPHHPDGAVPEYRQVCRCRKPSPGLLEQACRDLDLDPARSFMVGDMWRDVQSGAAVGARTILVRTGHGARVAEHPPAGVRADAILSNLMEAVGWILRTCERS
jgi:D-glycero-D-manno-heptose 1,7-bisphosphate phosphatase